MDLLTLEQIADLEGKEPHYVGFLRKQISEGYLKSQKVGSDKRGIHLVKRKDYEAWKADKHGRGEPRKRVKRKRKVVD